MNIFSNIGITELVVILVLALLVVGPERLGEMAVGLGKIVRGVRKGLLDLTRDIPPEFQSGLKATHEFRETIDSMRTIPKDIAKSVADAADLGDTIADLQQVGDSIEQVRRTASTAAKAVKSPLSAAAEVGRDALALAESGQRERQEPADIETVQADADESEDQASE